MIILSTGKNTKIEDAIRYVYNHGGVVAGTSAGAMVLGELAVYSEEWFSYF